MLIASEIKGELARIQPARRCCQRAELVGLLLGDAPGRAVRMFDHRTARIAVQLAGLLGVEASAPDLAAPHRSRRRLRITIQSDLAAAWSWQDAPACDRRAFLRGALLSGASISLGSGGPHVEFVLRTARAANELRWRLADSGVHAGLSRRRGRQVVYIKGSEEVATLLRLTGANRGLLDFETERVGRDVRNRLNRLMNAEAANVARTVRAADRQLRAIAELESTGELRELGRGLQEAAAQRRLHPEADLDDLARALGVSRSAVNHRLRRIVEIAAPPPPSAVPTARR
jgi:DNA-binding transcriptional regulator WhiA